VRGQGIPFGLRPWPWGGWDWAGCLLVTNLLMADLQDDKLPPVHGGELWPVHRRCEQGQQPGVTEQRSGPALLVLRELWSRARLKPCAICMAQGLAADADPLDLAGRWLLIGLAPDGCCSPRAVNNPLSIKSAATPLLVVPGLSYGAPGMVGAAEEALFQKPRLYGASGWVACCSRCCYPDGQSGTASSRFLIPRQACSPGCTALTMQQGSTGRPPAKLLQKIPADCHRGGQGTPLRPHLAQRERVCVRFPNGIDLPRSGRAANGRSTWIAVDLDALGALSRPPCASIRALPAQILRRLDQMTGDDNRSRGTAFGVARLCQWRAAACGKGKTINPKSAPTAAIQN